MSESETRIHEFNIRGIEAVEKTVKSGSGHSARINVPPSWQGKRVMVVRLE
jgi:putative transposon-encoded protein